MKSSDSWRLASGLRFNYSQLYDFWGCQKFMGDLSDAKFVIAVAEDATGSRRRLRHDAFAPSALCLQQEVGEVGPFKHSLATPSWSTPYCCTHSNECFEVQEVRVLLGWSAFGALFTPCFGARSAVRSRKRLDTLRREEGRSVALCASSGRAPVVHLTPCLPAPVSSPTHQLFERGADCWLTWDEGSIHTASWTTTATCQGVRILTFRDVLIEAWRLPHPPLFFSFSSSCFTAKFEWLRFCIIHSLTAERNWKFRLHTTTDHCSSGSV